VLLRFEGLPASTVSAEIKFIYHFEGTPSILDNTVLISATPPAIVGSMASLEGVR